MSPFNVLKLHNLVLRNVSSNLMPDCPWLYNELLNDILRGYRLKIEDPNSWAIKCVSEREVNRTDTECNHIKILEKLLEE